ncbi:hypothetical protein GW17_00018102 [Ensete ventricosum]|nr:hypothetical protein GW17_00018102 [Ensete ventricosum]
MKMRSQYIPEEARSTIMNFFRIPLNIFVCVVFYNVSIETLYLLILMKLKRLFLANPISFKSRLVMPTSNLGLSILTRFLGQSMSTSVSASSPGESMPALSLYQSMPTFKSRPVHTDSASRSVHADFDLGQSTSASSLSQSRTTSISTSPRWL